jgi:UMF1 family MFS transporter
MVFYNSLLPAIATPEKIGRISGYGWGLGYIGGLAALVVALVGFVQPETPWFGMSREAGFNIRATNLMVAVWFLLFSLPFFLVVREERRPGARTTPGEAIRELRRTFHEVRRFRESAKFLLARLIYNDGLVTIFAFGGIYAAGTFGFSFTEILIFGIVINVAAGLGALSFGFIDDLIGGKNTVMVSVVALGVATGLAAWAPSREWLWVAGIMIGIFAGPNQSASRSLMGRFVPAGRQAEFFGFFAFSGKFTAFLGPLFLGLATQWFDSQRWGVATVLLFFVVGGLLLISVNERAGIAAARSEDFSGA